MSAEEHTEEKIRRPTPYTEEIQDPPPQRNPPIVYKPTKPKDLFEKYRDAITRNIHKVWPKLQEDYVPEPFQANFRYYDYGGQYNFICEMPPDDRPTYICITENFEKEDGDLANDDAERRRRVIISVS